MTVNVYQLEFVSTSSNSSKFYRAMLDGSLLLTQWGRRGTLGQSRIEQFSSPPAASAAASRVLGAKQRKGYSPTLALTIPGPLPTKLTQHAASQLESQLQHAATAQNASLLAQLSTPTEPLATSLALIPDWEGKRAAWSWARTAADALELHPMVKLAATDSALVSIPDSLVSPILQLWPGTILADGEVGDDRAVLEIAASLWLESGEFGELAAAAGAARALA